MATEIVMLFVLGFILFLYIPYLILTRKIFKKQNKVNEDE